MTIANYLKLLLIKTVIFLTAITSITAEENNTSEGQSFTLKEAQAYAINHNKTLKNARLGTEIARHQIRETRSAGFPQINADVTAQHFVDIPVSLIPAEFLGGESGEFAEVQFGTSYDLNASITARQMIFDGPYIIALKASREFADLSRLEKERTEIETRQNVARAYLTALVLRENVDILSGNVEQIRKIYEETKILYENGFVESLDVDRLKLTYSRIGNQEKQLRRQLTVSENLLKFQMGYPLEDTIVLSDQLTAFTEINTEELAKEAGEFNPESRIEYKMLLNRENLSHLNMQRYRTSYLPSLSAFITHRQNAQRDEFSFFEQNRDWFPATIIGLTIEIPIFDGFWKHAKIQQLHLEKEQVFNERLQFKESAEMEVYEAFSEFYSAMETKQVEAENLELAERIYETTNIKYSEGVGSSLELIDAQNMLYDSRSQYINALYDMLMASVKLEVSLAKF
jgi:outer membrane protein